jgi:hypothetical protein
MSQHPNLLTQRLHRPTASPLGTKENRFWLDVWNNAEVLHGSLALSTIW